MLWYAKYRSIIVTDKKLLGYAKYCSIIVTAKYWYTQNIVQLSLPQNIGIRKIWLNYRYRKILGYAKYCSIIVTAQKKIGICKMLFNYRYRPKKNWDMQNVVQLSLPKKIPPKLGYAKCCSIIVTAPKKLEYAKCCSIIVTDKNL